MTQPACMTDAEYDLWSRSIRYAPAGTPCLDCPLAFAEAMRVEGCCNGRPGRHNGRPVLYASDEERRVAKRRQWRESAARKAARA
jgi:hypothetical protein